MRKLILATIILAIAGIAPAIARSGHGHSHHHGHVSRAEPAAAPANPSAPSAQPANPPALVSEKEKMDPEDAALDKRIKSICRGC